MRQSHTSGLFGDGDGTDRRGVGEKDPVFGHEHALAADTGTPGVRVSTKAHWLRHIAINHNARLSVR